MAYKFQRGAFNASGSYVQDGGDIEANGTHDIVAKALLTTAAAGGSGDVNCATLVAGGGGIQLTAGDSATNACAVQIQDGSDNAVVSLGLDTNTNAIAANLSLRKAAAKKLTIGVAEDTDDAAAKGGTAYSSYMVLNDGAGNPVITAFGQSGVLTGKKFELGVGNTTCDTLTVAQNLTVNGSLVQMNVADGILVADKSGRVASAATNLGNSVDSGFQICSDGGHANGGAFRYVDDSDMGGNKVVNGRHFVFAKKNGNTFAADFAGSNNLPDAQLAAVKADVFYGNGDEITNLPTTSVTRHTANATLSAGGYHLVDLVTAGGDVTLTLPDGDAYGDGNGGHIFHFKVISNAASSSGKKLIIKPAANNVILEEGGDIASTDAGIFLESDFAAISLIQGAGSQAAERKWSIH